MLLPLERRLADALSIDPDQVRATMTLLDEGATVPFIARYRKEATCGLDDTQLRSLAEKLTYLRDLDSRRESVRNSIEEQGGLTPALAASLDAAETRQRIEDLYLPFKRKRRTRAQIAVEAGLAALAEQLLANPETDPQSAAADYLRPPFKTEAGDNPGVADAAAALAGARLILTERLADDAELLGRLRDKLQTDGVVRSTVRKDKAQAGAKYSDYFEHQEPVAKIPSHRALAMLRGRKEEILNLVLGLPDGPAVLTKQLVDDEGNTVALDDQWFVSTIATHAGISAQGRAADDWLMDTAHSAWQHKLSLHVSTDIFSKLRELAEANAIDVFGDNLKDLLLAAPAGSKVAIGLDPGLRTGVKVAVVDANGKLLDTATIYPNAPRNDISGASKVLKSLITRHAVELIAIGNGTASRETERFVDQLLRQIPDQAVSRVMVSEAGASVYSASAFAASEFPTLDVSLRGAVSIARRLQDPLAELVKIEPKAIGVGQYQHDVNQARLGGKLDAVVEDCVNHVGVNLNTASAPLLSRVAGLSESMAENIVAYRDQNGAFANRQQVLKVKRVGERTFEQAAGFLRIADGDNPLDASAVHPEAYPVVERMLADLRCGIGELMDDPARLAGVNPAEYVDQQFGLPTINDILEELKKPGRDPRPAFETARFQEGVESLEDLQPGMVLEGVVSNVTAFGAFVDVGVHQDGLVHVSAMADHFVSDPRSVVSAGQIVKVKVMSIDLPRKRIGLSMRLSDEPDSESGTSRRPTDSSRRAASRDKAPRHRTSGKHPKTRRQAAVQNDEPSGALAVALREATRSRKR